MALRHSWFRGVTYMRSIRLATRYRGGKPRLGRRALLEPAWPYLLLAGLIVGAILFGLAGSLLF